MQLINLTPHPIDFVHENGKVMATIPSCAKEQCARVLAETVHVHNIEAKVFNGNNDVIFDIPVSETKFGVIQNLPEEREKTVYIVSRMVAEAAKERNDLAIVNETVRDSNCKIVGAKSISFINK